MKNSGVIQPSANNLSLLACQIAVPSMQSAEQRDEHLRRTKHLIEQQLTTQPSDVVVLPELSSLDYSRKCFEQLAQVAEHDTGASFQCWRLLARDHQCFVVYGFARKVADQYQICTAVVSPAGELVAVYEKLHLAQFGDSMEKEYFNSAGSGLVVFEVNGIRLAPIICYDIRFPELCRELVLHKQVDVILHVGAYARDPSFYSWHAFTQTRAVENQCYVLSLNRAGAHFGSSLFCGPWVDEQHPPLQFDSAAEQFQQLIVSKDTIGSVRQDFTFLDDRLNDYNLPVRP